MPPKENLGGIIMKEREPVNIVAMTVPCKKDGTIALNAPIEWRHGWMHPRTRIEILSCPPNMPMVDIPLQLNGVGVGVPFGLVDVFEYYDAREHGGQRSNS